MVNLRRPYSSKDKDIVGWFNPNGRCKKHLKHQQSPGVCSLCLKDKLSQLSSASSSSKRTTIGTSCDSSSASSSLSSYYSSSSASSLASPMHPFKGRQSGSSISNFILSSSSKRGLVKSRSLAFLPRRRKDGEQNNNNKKSAKKEGFWFKLLHPKSKRSMEKKDIKMVHSKSLRETTTLAS